MKKALLAIGISTILVTLSILPIASVGCQQAPPLPKMTAAEVCQYVNQALPNEYVYRTPALRYEYRYTALSAQYIGGSNHYQEDVWEVSVRETVEYQCLYEGQWTLFHGGSPVSQTVKYIFNEITGAVTK